jgi:hypothetical protein
LQSALADPRIQLAKEMDQMKQENHGIGIAAAQPVPEKAPFPPAQIRSNGRRFPIAGFGPQQEQRQLLHPRQQRVQTRPFQKGWPQAWGKKARADDQVVTQYLLGRTPALINRTGSHGHRCTQPGMIGSKS